MAATLTPPQVIPLTTAPSQTFNITLGGQFCTIDVYTKTINRPLQEPDETPVVPVLSANFNGSLTGNVLTVAALSGTLGVGYGVLAAAVTPTLPGGAEITRIISVGARGNGTYEVYPGTVPVDADGNYAPSATPPTIAGPMSGYTPSAPRYENTNPVFLDLAILNAPIIQGVHLRNSAMVLMNQYLGFVGDLSLIDTSGRYEDPFGVPATLPNPPSLRNAWQRSVPLKLEGKVPASVANRIPGLGTRWLLTYWPNLK